MKTTKFKKLVAMLLAMAMTASLFTMYAYAANTDENTDHKTTFTDVTPDKWYYEAVMAMADAGAVNGYGNGKFGPNDPVTYGQFALIIMRLCWPEEYVDGDDPTYDGLDEYTSAMLDCRFLNQAGPFSPFAQYYAIKDGQIMPAGYWWPKDYDQDFGKLLDEWKDIKVNTYANVPVQRGQAMTYLAKLAGGDKKVIRLSMDTTITEASIPDWNVVAANDHKTLYPDNWAAAQQIGIPTLWKDWVLKAYQMGIVQGTDSNMTCNPLGTVTRAQFCQMLYNMGLYEPHYGVIKLH